MVEPIGKNQEDMIEEAVQRYVDARSRGEQPDTDEFVRQYPELEPQLRQRIGNLEKTVSTSSNSIDRISSKRAAA